MSVYYMFNKPRGCITARRDDRHKTVMDYFPGEQRFCLHPLGRLDLDTEGLLIVSDDGMLDQLIMQPERHVEKKYYFWAIGEPTPEKIQQLERGVVIEEGSVTRPAKVRVVSTAKMRDICHLLSDRHRPKLMKNPDVPVFEGYLTITEGKKHQVKRMLRAVRCCVVYLKRVAIGGVELDESLNPGEYRSLTQKELNDLCKM